MRTFPRHVKNLIVQARRRAKFIASIRPADVFLVTYPRSGTTWLSFLIAQVIRPSPQEQLHVRSLVNYVPDINGVYFGDGSLQQYAALRDPRFFSVHCTYDWWFSRAVYLLRDPRDVMVSYWHYRKLTDASFQLSLREFILSDDHWPCRWDEHVATWLLSGRRPRLLVLRYEEMHQDTAGVLRRVLDFSGARYEAADIDRAVSASRFETMRSLEEKFGLGRDGLAPEERFIRRGEIGGWRKELDEECVRILEEKYSRVMQEVGYAPILHRVQDVTAV